MKMKGTDMEMEASNDGKVKGPNGVETNCLMVAACVAAELIGISRTTFWRLHSEGKVPSPIRFGRATRWRRAELVAWVRAGCPPRDKWIWKERCA